MYMEGNGLISRQGGKYTKRKQIFKRFPPTDYTTYVEPFVGGGSIFLEAPLVSKMIAGDSDTRLIHLFQDLKTLDVPMVQAFNFNVPFDKEKWERADKYARSKKKGTARFLANLLIRKFSFSNMANAFLNSKSFETRNYQNLKKQLPELKERVKDVTFLHKPYNVLLDKYDGPNTFFYLDPPYYKTYSGAYETGEIDHELLAERLKKVKGKFLLSYNDTPFIRKLYKGYKITSFKNTQTLGSEDNIKIVRDVLISNY
jgi:DNA adenine methylase